MKFMHSLKQLCDKGCTDLGKKFNLAINFLFNALKTLSKGNNSERRGGELFLRVIT